ncbi:hypothetical protein FKM82_013399 [Ascaphus truei]
MPRNPTGDMPPIPQIKRFSIYHAGGQYPMTGNMIPKRWMYFACIFLVSALTFCPAPVLIFFCECVRDLLPLSV